MIYVQSLVEFQALQSYTGTYGHTHLHSFLYTVYRFNWFGMLLLSIIFNSLSVIIYISQELMKSTRRMWISMLYSLRFTINCFIMKHEYEKKHWILSKHELCRRQPLCSTHNITSDTFLRLIFKNKLKDCFYRLHFSFIIPNQ